MKFLLLLLNLLFTITTFSQIQNPNTRGTIIVSVICKDGIVMCADSRSSFTNQCQDGLTVTAYFDSVRKICTLGNYLIGVAGFSGLKGELWENLIDGYNKKYKSDSTLLKTFMNFKSYVSKKLNVSDHAIFNSVFFMAGYENGSPLCLVIDSNGVKSVNKFPYRFYSDSSFGKYYNAHPLDPSHTIDVANFLEQRFFEFYKTKQAEMVGGPVMALEINNKNKIKELKTFKPLKFKNVIELDKSILSGKTNLIFTSPVFKEDLMKGLKITVRYPQILLDY
ncbi:hypothetical protein ACI6Q2_13575 [Chitinophagaceae bacterium LWZ2-11]